MGLAIGAVAGAWGETPAFPLARASDSAASPFRDRRSAAETASRPLPRPAVAFSQLGEPRSAMMFSPSESEDLFEHAQRGGVVLLVDEATAYTM